jgi:hypothetical protein
VIKLEKITQEFFAECADIVRRDLSELPETIKRFLAKHPEKLGFIKGKIPALVMHHHVRNLNIATDDEMRAWTVENFELQSRIKDVMTDPVLLAVEVNRIVSNIQQYVAKRRST